MADHWNPQQDDHFKNAPAVDKLSRQGSVYSTTLRRLCDRQKNRRRHSINIGQTQSEDWAKLFDTDGDGKADSD
jgi:hypothetical protein